MPIINTIRVQVLCSPESNIRSALPYTAVHNNIPSIPLMLAEHVKLIQLNACSSFPILFSPGRCISFEIVVSVFICSSYFYTPSAQRNFIVHNIRAKLIVKGRKNSFVILYPYVICPEAMLTNCIVNPQTDTSQLNY